MLFIIIIIIIIVKKYPLIYYSIKINTHIHFVNIIINTITHNKMEDYIYLIYRRIYAIILK
jgi:hypothetical protein